MMPKKQQDVEIAEPCFVNEGEAPAIRCYCLLDYGNVQKFSVAVKGIYGRAY